MSFLRQILFAVTAVIGFSLTASAQRQQPDKKEKPPKPHVEIRPEDKKPKNNENKDNNQNKDGKKKPQAFFLISENRVEISSI